MPVFLFCTENHVDVTKTNDVLLKLFSDAQYTVTVVLPLQTDDASVGSHFEYWDLRQEICGYQHLFFLMNASS